MLADKLVQKLSHGLAGIPDLPVTAERLEARRVIAGWTEHEREAALKDLEAARSRLLAHLARLRAVESEPLPPEDPAQRQLNAGLTQQERDLRALELLLIAQRRRAVARGEPDPFAVRDPASGPQVQEEMQKEGEKEDP